MRQLSKQHNAKQIEMLGSGANISIKLHYLHSHIDKFAENLGAICDEQHIKLYL